MKVKLINLICLYLFWLFPAFTFDKFKKIFAFSKHQAPWPEVYKIIN